MSDWKDKVTSSLKSLEDLPSDESKEAKALAVLKLQQLLQQLQGGDEEESDKKEGNGRDQELQEGKWVDSDEKKNKDKLKEQERDNHESKSQSEKNESGQEKDEEERSPENALPQTSTQKSTRKTVDKTKTVLGSPVKAASGSVTKTPTKKPKGTTKPMKAKDIFQKSGADPETNTQTNKPTSTTQLKHEFVESKATALAAPTNTEEKEHDNIGIPEHDADQLSKITPSEVEAPTEDKESHYAGNPIEDRLRRLEEELCKLRYENQTLKLQSPPKDPPKKRGRGRPRKHPKPDQPPVTAAAVEVVNIEPQAETKSSMLKRKNPFPKKLPVTEEGPEPVAEAGPPKAARKTTRSGRVVKPGKVEDTKIETDNNDEEEAHIEDVHIVDDAGDVDFSVADAGLDSSSDDLHIIATSDTEEHSQCDNAIIEEPEVPEVKLTVKIPKKRGPKHPHNRIIRHQCQMCGEEFTHGRPFHKHLLQHDGENSPRCCRKCKQECHNQLFFEHHKCYIKKWTKDIKRCKVCGKMFTNYKKYKRHLKDVHQMTGGEVYCQFCKKPFRKKPALYAHYKEHSGGLPVCLRCGKFCEDEKDYEKHMAEHKENMLYYCDKCGQGFDRSQSYELHLEGHRKNSCIICNQHFSQRKLMLKHCRLAHQLKFPSTEDRKHQCNVCGKMMLRPGALEVHMRIHTETPDGETGL